ncbi:hypothetical protein NQZ68_033653 [Dissostichus eleginoides]|nr:hypothetical protein NQZ68_033653 [Dissostichus eleginoides]
MASNARRGLGRCPTQQQPIRDEKRPLVCPYLNGIVISSVLGSVAAEGAEGTTGGEASDDSSITVVQIGQN